MRKSIEELENLPKRISHSKYARTENKYWNWGESRFRGINVYSIANRIVDANIGKSFDMTFSYFCKKIHHKQRWYHCFLDKFSSNGDDKFSRYTFYDYFVDENRLIQKYNRIEPKKMYIWKSNDYKDELRYVSDDRVVSKLSIFERNRRNYNGDKTYRFILSGEVKSYPYGSRIATKLISERAQKLRKLERQELIAKREIQYCFLSKNELQVKKDKELSWIDRDRLGFGKDSFKGIEYHGQKRKLKLTENE